MFTSTYESGGKAVDTPIEKTPEVGKNWETKSRGDTNS